MVGSNQYIKRGILECQYPRTQKFQKCLMAKNKENLILDIINRDISYKSAEIISKLYRSC